MRVAFPILLLAAAVPLPGAAQPVVGTVVEEGTGTPVPGAMVILFDSTETRVARTLTDPIGRFRLRARHPGSHYVTVERIGYADWTTDLFEPAPGGEFLRIRIPVRAIPIEGLDVSGGRRCEVRPEEGLATARVWEEVRKALAAEEYTREASLYRYALLVYRRQLDRNARKTIDGTSTMLEDQQAAFRSFPIEHLVDRGFVQMVADSAIYFAPDAGALLSDAFLDTHCLELREGEEGKEERIGLAFRPLDDRDVPEVAGVLWVDAATSELERLEFAYVNLIRSREVGEPGGEVAFARLPDGAWIVREWRIRMPHLEWTILGYRRRSHYEEVGGVTWAITDSRGRTILHAATASISGVVTDSAGTAPPSGPVVVQLVGTGKQTVPLEDGSFVLTELSAGRHLLRVQPPLLSNWGMASPSEAVADARLGRIAHVRLRTPSVADALAASCGGAPRPEGTAAFMGRITTAEGPPAAGMTVVLRWPRASGHSPPPVAAPLGPDGTPDRTWTFGRDGAFATATTTTDWRGIFLLCDVPAGSRLLVSLRGPVGGDPVLTETRFVPPGVPAVVENLVVPDRSGGERPRVGGAGTRNPGGRRASPGEG
ncbi:MAG: carboxypeptidase regulatory-like domain-containing protein [Gemmatimonadota bacterium]|nr:carboxypeptidase regulatory-like domain-containing protein [Gemmatimonadota bacterium]